MDKKIQQDGIRVVGMAERLIKLESFQEQVENGLSYVRGQQTELERLLDELEKSIPAPTTTTTITTLTGTSRPPATAANEERLRMFDDLQGIHKQVDIINSQISSLVEQVNDSATSHSSKKAFGKDDLPLSAVLELLNSHLDSMQLMDRKIDYLTGGGGL